MVTKKTSTKRAKSSDPASNASEIEPVDSGLSASSVGDAVVDAVGDDDEPDSLLDGIASLPRVGEIGVQTRLMSAAVAPPAEPQQKANIQWRLKPFVPRVKKQMVTMSDLGMNGGTRTTAKPSRNKLKP